MQTLKLKYIALGIRVCLFFLLLAHGIESNPGPDTEIAGASSGTRRGGSSGVGSNAGQRNPTSLGNKQYNQYKQNKTNPVRGRGSSVAGRGAGTGRRSSVFEGTIPGSDRVLRSSEASQNVMSSWLNRDRQSTGGTHNSQSEAHAEPSRDLSSSFSGLFYDDDDDEADIKTVLLDIRREVRKTNHKFDSLECKVNNLKVSHDSLVVDHEELQKNHDELKSENQALSEKVNNMSKKLDQLENQSRRENLVFHGMEEEADETWETSEGKVRSYIDENLGLDETSILIERAHRLNTKTTPRPIIVKFSLFKDRDKVLKSYRETRAKERTDQTEQSTQPGEQPAERPGASSNEREQTVRVSEDFSARVRKIRRNLRPFLQDYLKDKQDAYIKFDKLVVNRTVYAYDEVDKKLIEI